MLNIMARKCISLLKAVGSAVANLRRVALTRMGRRNRRRQQQLRRRETSLMPATVSKPFHGFMHVGEENNCFYL